jgi:hypothetical protein
MILSIVKKMPDRSNDPFVKLYASTVGLGEKSGSDWYKIADENIDTAIDVGVTLALASVSMGVGALAARGAMAATAWSLRASR